MASPSDAWREGRFLPFFRLLDAFAGWIPLNHRPPGPVEVRMPYARCPQCSRSFHLNVSDLEGWYRERWPMLPIGAEVAEECPVCRGKRTGVEFSWAERVRSYDRKEFSEVLDRLPDRGAKCSGCNAVVPRFSDLSGENERRIKYLIAQNRKIMAIQELMAATGCPLSWAQVWIDHPNGPELHDKGKRGPDCPYCGKPLRTAVARQCVECGMDWHDLRQVHRLGVGSEAPSPGESGPPEILGGSRVIAWTSKGLVIAHDEGSKGWFRFECDSNWKVSADTWHETLADAQRGIADPWHYRPPKGSAT